MFHDQVTLSLGQFETDFFADGDLLAMLHWPPKEAPYYFAFPGVKIRRTEVRPICSRRAISALLMPAR